MSLPWQTNWTHAMKTNATANRLLNTRIGDSTFFVVPEIAAKKPFISLTMAEFIGLDKEKKPQFTGYAEHTWYDFEKAAKHMESIMKSPEITEKDVKDLTDAERGKIVAVSNDEFKGEPARIKEPEEITSEDMDSILNNTYVKDYLNIHHPSIRVDLTPSLTDHPLQVKPPPVFFSS